MVSTGFASACLDRSTANCTAHTPCILNPHHINKPVGTWATIHIYVAHSHPRISICSIFLHFSLLWVVWPSLGCHTHVPHRQLGMKKPDLPFLSLVRDAVGLEAIVAPDTFNKRQQRTQRWTTKLTHLSATSYDKYNKDMDKQVVCVWCVVTVGRSVWWCWWCLSVHQCSIGMDRQAEALYLTSHSI